LEVWSEPEISEIITLISHMSLIALNKRNSYSSIQFELLSSSMYEDDQDDYEEGPIEKMMKEQCDLSNISVESLINTADKLISRIDKQAKYLEEELFEHTVLALGHMVALTNPATMPSLNQSWDVHYQFFEKIFRVLLSKIKSLVFDEKSKSGRTLVLHLLKACRKVLQNNSIQAFKNGETLIEERKVLLVDFAQLVKDGLFIANNSGKKVFRKKVQLYASKLVRCFMNFCTSKHIDEFAISKNGVTSPFFILDNPLIEYITDRALWFEVHAEYIFLMSAHYRETADVKLKDVMDCVVTVTVQFLCKVRDNAKNVLQGLTLGKSKPKRRQYDEYDSEEEDDLRQIKFTKKEVSRALNTLTISLPNIGVELFNTYYQDMYQITTLLMDKSLLTVGVDSICMLSGLLKAMKKYDPTTLDKELYSFVTKVFPLIKGNYQEDEITMMDSSMDEEDGDFETEIALTCIDFYHAIFVDSEIREICK